MARKPRFDVEGGLYHIISRGNNRQRIFRHDEDYQKMLSLVAVYKKKLPFFLYSYCLMPNHIHLFLERQEDAVGRVMHRILSTYSRYYNRKYGRVGHLFQCRYKGILCQSDKYLAELVRYIHLNPVRAKMVRRAIDYSYSSHRAYLGLDRTAFVDVDPVLRHFGATKKLARERFELFVQAGAELGHRNDYYGGTEGGILGSEEFIEEMNRRIGEIPVGARPSVTNRATPNLKGLLRAVAAATGLSREEICSARKTRRIVRAKEAMIVVGYETGADITTLANFIGIDDSVVSKRLSSCKTKMEHSTELLKLVKRVRKALSASNRK